MSRRAIKRYEQHVLESTQDSSDSSDGDEAHELSPKPNQNKSLFALLAAQESSGHDSDDTDDGDDGANNPNPAEPSATPDPSNIPSPHPPPQDQSVAQVATKTTATKKKRRKKKGRKRNDQQQRAHPDDDSDWLALNEALHPQPSNESTNTTTAFIPSTFFNSDDDDDVRNEAARIMQLIQDMAFPREQERNTSVSSANIVRMSFQALKVDPNILNADAELKRLFGARVVESERRIEEASAAASARRRGRHLSNRTNIHRKVSFISPRETWPDHAPGLIMQRDHDVPDTTSSDGVKYFRYAHEASYASIQEIYRGVVRVYDPDSLVGFSRRYPYHVDSLLQVAELFRQMGELDRAAEQIERCLYVLEASWHIMFKPFHGMCRMRFDILENRSVYVALFRYSQLLTRRGLHRTALEISKLLLNLDPVMDPMGVLLLADSYALLSGEYQWVFNMIETYQEIRMEYFPNFAASSAIAAECMRLGVRGISNRGGPSKIKRGGQGEDKGQNETNGVGSSEGAENMLIDALLTFPMILGPILTVIEDSSMIVSEFRLYEEGWYTAGSRDLGVLTRIGWVYADRSKLLWNSSRNKELLLRCARRAGQLDEAAGMGKDERTGQLTSMYVSDAGEHERVARCRARRFEAGRWLSGSGLYRDVIIADFVDSTTSLPAEILAGERAEQTVGAGRPTEVTMARGAMEFIQSLLPWREARDARRDEDE